MKNKILIGSIIALLGIWVGFSLHPSDSLGQQSGYPNSYSSGVVYASSSVGTSAAIVLGQTSTSIWSMIANVGSVTAFCQKNNTTTNVTATNGTPILPNGSWETDANDAYSGGFVCVTSSGTTTFVASYR